MFQTINNRPFVVAGPCSVESREQLQQVTMALKTMPQVRLIRGGVWKPRTRPGGFEGLGEQALIWMRDISTEHGVGFCCEVARPEQVELCLRYGIDAVWLGARTTTNPFMVDELCTALRGTGLPVMVKNPVCPDVRLWLGAIERLQAVGINDIAAIHRGFNMYNNRGYRNAPLWEVALELRREMPDVPILCDPSHIGGQAALVKPLSIAAHQLDYSGLMVEVHPHPTEAWTDSTQQLTPDELSDIVNTWLSDTPTPDSDHALDALEPLRSKIDDIDHELISLLSQRMAVSRRIANVKRTVHMPVYQQARWTDVINDRLRLADALGLDETFVHDMLEKIHAESVRIQMED